MTPRNEIIIDLTERIGRSLTNEGMVNQILTTQLTVLLDIRDLLNK